MKNFFALFFAFLLSFSLLVGCDNNGKNESNVTSAESEEESEVLEALPAEDFGYIETDEGGISVNYYKGKEKNIVIPKEINGKPVVGIKSYGVADSGFPFFSNLSDVTVIVPEGVKIIGRSAFQNCTELVSISLPESLEFIAEHAFYNCTSLQELTINSNCLNENSVGVFAKTAIESFSFPEDITIIPMQAFYGTKLRSVTFPDSIKEIDTEAFKNCENLEEVNLNDGLEILGKNTFSNTAIKEIKIPKTVSKINEYSFGECPNLEKVFFEGNAPENFMNMNSTYAEVPSNNYTLYFNKDAVGFQTPKWYGYNTQIIGEETTLPRFEDFEYSEIENEITITDYFGSAENIVIPSQINRKSVTKIGVSAFNDIDTVKTIEIPESIISIEDRAFANCNKLKNVILNNGLERIGVIAFCGCNELSDITLPETLTTIGEMAFGNLRSLKEVTIPKNLKEWDGAFFAASLKKVNLEEGLTVISENAFSMTNIIDITIPASVVRIESGAFIDCGSLRKITFSGNAPEILVENGKHIANENIEISFSSEAKGFDSPEWECFKKEIW